MNWRFDLVLFSHINNHHQTMRISGRNLSVTHNLIQSDCWGDNYLKNLDFE